MILYAYDRESGEYLGPVQCQVDPEGSRLAGETVYLRPANAVDDPPGGDPPERWCWCWRADERWPDGRWMWVEDHRGEPAWEKATGRPVVIHAIGPLPDGLTTADPTPPAEPERRLVAKRVIIDRLHAAGLLEIARKTLDAAPLYTRERWNSRDAVFADDPETIAFLRLIGADPDTILA